VVLLDDKAELEAHSGRFGDSANHGARLVHSLQQKYHWLENHFGRTDVTPW
jgi:hypothetical protein